MRIAFYTLGCKANQFDTQALEAFARERGHGIVSFDEVADAYIINTCTVTAVSDKKSRQMIRRTRRQNPDAVVAVCGCFAQTAPDAAASLGVDVVAGAQNRAHFVELLEEAAAKRGAGETHRFISDVRAHERGAPFEVLPAGAVDDHTRALLKIQDGCDNRCSYCIIPEARGFVRSMPMESIRAQMRQLADAGFREVVITGIEISSYGRDLPGGERLADAVEAAAQAAPGMRIHLGSLEPRTVTEAFVHRMATLPNLCPHFHLSLQSGCDATLRRMRRQYTTARYAESVRLLRAGFDNVTLTTDLIAGFPGETDEEFACTLAYIESLGFSDMHIFPYSRRTGTPAASFPDQVPRAVREARAAQAAGVAAAMRKVFLDAQVGRAFDVLFETWKDGIAAGHSAHYVQVQAEAAAPLRGEVRRVYIDARTEQGLSGTILA